MLFTACQFVVSCRAIDNNKKREIRKKKRAPLALVSCALVRASRKVTLQPPLLLLLPPTLYDYDDGLNEKQTEDVSFVS